MSATEYGSVTELVSISPGGRRVDLDRPAVLVADARPSTLHVPSAASKLGRHARRVARCARLPDLERHRPRGRRPERAASASWPDTGRAERRRGEGVGVEVVEHARHLHAGERAQRAIRRWATASCSVRSCCAVAAVEADRVQREVSLELRGTSRAARRRGRRGRARARPARRLRSTAPSATASAGVGRVLERPGRIVSGSPRRAVRPATRACPRSPSGRATHRCPRAAGRSRRSRARASRACSGTRRACPSVAVNV